MDNATDVTSYEDLVRRHVVSRTLTFATLEHWNFTLMSFSGLFPWKCAATRTVVRLAHACARVGSKDRSDPGKRGVIFSLRFSGSSIDSKYIFWRNLAKRSTFTNAERASSTTWSSAWSPSMQTLQFPSRRSCAASSHTKSRAPSSPCSNSWVCASLFYIGYSRAFRSRRHEQVCCIV